MFLGKSTSLTLPKNPKLYKLSAYSNGIGSYGLTRSWNTLPSLNYTKFTLCFSTSTQPANINLSEGPVSELNKKLANGELLLDKHQQQIAGQLQNVYNNLQGYSPPTENLFTKIFLKKLKNKSPKGLYIYGAVGGGKTMLMDLFHNCFLVSN